MGDGYTEGPFDHELSNEEKHRINDAAGPHNDIHTYDCTHWTNEQCNCWAGCA